MLVFMSLGPIWNICSSSDGRTVILKNWEVQHSSVFIRILDFLGVCILGWEILCCGTVPIIGYWTAFLSCAYHLLVEPLYTWLVVLAKNVSNCSYMFLGCLRMWNLTERGFSKSPGWETSFIGNVEIVSLAVWACLCSHHLQSPPTLFTVCFLCNDCVLIRTEDNSWPI